MVGEMLQRCDSDNNGSLTIFEIATQSCLDVAEDIVGNPIKSIAQIFSEADRNSDGIISKDEMTIAILLILRRN